MYPVLFLFFYFYDWEKIPLSMIWRGLPAEFANLQVMWRDIGQLTFQDEVDYSKLDKNIVYRNTEGTRSTDIVFQARITGR